jgi:hypothetical protein
VVEHRIARLVQLGIRQARYIGRTRTLFQLCLAAAVANLTLLAAPSDPATGDHLWLISVLVALTPVLNLMVGPARRNFHVGDFPDHDPLPYLAVPLICPLQAISRPAF